MSASDQTFGINLTRAERQLLLEKTELPLPIAAAIESARQERGICTCTFTCEELIQIGDAIHDALPRLRKHSDRSKLRRFLEQIGSTLDAFFEEEECTEGEPIVASQMNEELQAELNKILASGDYAHLDELNASVAVVVNRFNQKGQKELGGLSPVQVRKLLCADWESTESPIQINESLSFEELKRVPLVLNARLFLAKACDGIQATAKGNLNRKFVELMLHEMELPAGYLEEVMRYNKVRNEDDVWPLHVTRILLDLARLIRKTKGTFRTTKKGQKLSGDENTGKLYALLFHTHFRVFNLSYCDSLPEDLPIQETITYSLCQVSRHLGEWTNVEETPGILLLPAVLNHIKSYGYPDYPRVACSLRILHPLEELGLIERRDVPSDEKWERPYEVRKTQLFDRLLKFEV